MTSISVGAGGSFTPQNIEDLVKSASPDIIKGVADSAQQVAQENEAIKQAMLERAGTVGLSDPALLAQFAAAIDKQLQDALGGGRSLQPPEGKLAADVPGALDLMSRLSEQDVATDIYAFMALFQQLAQTMRTSAREVRQSEMTAQVDVLKNAAQEMRNAAQERMVGAMVAGAFQIVGGLAQVGASMMQGNALATGGKQADGLAKMHSDRGAGVAGIAGGIGSMVNAGQEHKAAQHEAKKAELEAQAKVHESGMQQATEMAQQMMDVIRDVRDKLSAIEQSRMETNRGIARNI